MRLTALLLITLLSIAACTSNTHKKTLYFPSVGWSMAVPDSLSIEDSLKLSESNPATSEAYDDSGTKALVSIYDTSVWRLNATNMRASIKAAGQNSPEELLQHIQTIKEEFIGITMQSEFNAKLDTSFSTEKTGGVTFEKQVYTLKFSGLTQTVILYSAIINNYFFDVSIFYVDEKKVVPFLDMWQSSTFKK